MNIENSFNYIFYDILKLIDDLTIHSQYRAIPEMETDEDGEASFTGDAFWQLNLIKFLNCNKSDLFKKRIKKHVNNTIDYLEENKTVLFEFYDYFIAEFDKRNTFFTELLQNQETLEQFINKGNIILIHKGFLSIYNHDSLIRDSIGLPQKDKELEKLSGEEIYRLISKFLPIACKYINKINLYLKHEYNIILIQNNRLGNIKENDNQDILIDLIRENKLNELFKLIKEDKAYKSNAELILLSSRHKALEDSKINNLIDWNTYQTDLSKINYSLISIITRENKEQKSS